MTREELLTQFDATMKQASDILYHRNSLYAKENDALFNIQKLGVNGILTQIREKCTRLENLVEIKTDDLKSVEDSIHDSCIDIINYSFLLECLTKFS